MAVLLPDRQLTLYAWPHPWERDANGVPVPPNPSVRPPARGTWPGAARETEEEGTWSLRLDPAAWPVEPGDIVTDDTGLSWTVSLARAHKVPGHPDADYVQVTATRNPPEVP